MKGILLPPLKFGDRVEDASDHHYQTEDCKCKKDRLLSYEACSENTGIGRILSRYVVKNEPARDDTAEKAPAELTYGEKPQNFVGDRFFHK